jgi:DNA-binding HxlR family transcriptional regulator
MNLSRRRERSASDASLGVPVEELVRLIRGRYKPDILIRLGKLDRLRFTQLRRAIPGLSDRALARQLDELERDGLIERTVYPEVPPVSSTT